MPDLRVAGVVSFVRRLFPQRQFYLRTRGSVQFFEFSPTFQIVVSIGTVLMAIWAVYASIVVVFKEQIITAKDSRYANMLAAYDGKVAQMQRSHDELSALLVLAEERFQNATRDLAQRHRQMTQLLMKKQAMAKRLREVRRQVAYMSDYRGAARIAMASADGANILMMQLSPAEPAVRQGRLALRPRDGTIKVIEEALQGRNAIIKRIGVLEERLGVVKKQQMALLGDVRDSLAGQIEKYERVVKMTGLPLQDGGGRTKHGEGGTRPMGPDMQFEQEFFEIDEAFGKLDDLTATVSRLPLVTPIAAGLYSRTSSFGNRIDPMTGRYAFHSGADMAGDYGTSILASAAGIVVAAERRGNYGNMVEIDHGQGIRTRYGHLQTILVKRGDRVRFRQKIATMGSTGRSTGPHLHYEVWVNNAPRDPTKFFNAGRHVYAGQ